MKLATFRAGASAHIGMADPATGQMFDLTRAAAADGGSTDQSAIFGSMLALIDAGDAGLDAARALHARHGQDAAFLSGLADTPLLAPLPEPRQMRDGMSFETHIRQAGSGRGRALAAARAKGDTAEVARIEAEDAPELPEIYRQMPIFYFTNRLTVAGPDTHVTWPRYSKVMDYELEFGIVTGRKGKNIPAAKAREHIYGYTIFNDLSARDQQFLEMQGRLGPAKGKSFENSNILGPWIVTKDEVPDPYNLNMTARVNGRTVCNNVSRDMLFTFEEIIAYASRDEWLHAGEFIGSGTVGNGCGLENGWFLSDGDTIELEVDRLGILRTTVSAAKPD